MKKLRWILFLPAGIFELFLALLSGLLATIHYVASVALYIAYMLPGIEWYLGGEYNRKKNKSALSEGKVQNVNKII